MTLNSRQFPEVYQQLGYNLDTLGCIMLDVESFDITKHVPGGEADLYTHPDPAKFWFKGAVGEQNAHISLLYGLLENGNTWRKQVDTVLAGWIPPLIEIEQISFFEGSLPGEDYSVIIGKVKVSDELLEGHHRLQLLPHIDTFAGYTPHVTLAYIKNGPSGVEWAKDAREKWVMSLAGKLPRALEVTGINYGSVA